MTSSCFGDLGGVKSSSGYKKLLKSKEESFPPIVPNVRLFSMKELQKATNNFSTLLGRRGFSSYFKGTLENGTLVMITVLLHGEGDVYEKPGLDFASLVITLSRIRHRNVVELIGYCLADDRKILVYEFVGDYNLEQLLFDKHLKALRTEFNWSTRVSMCIGIARGLEYLHEGGSNGVVHRDIKPSNIVLDTNLNPKIVDFGLAQVFDKNITQSSVLVSVKLGYMDPEYCREGRYAEKSDVYAFGILLLEVISGRKAHVSWVWELRESDRILEIVDPTLSYFPEDEVKRFVDVAFSCLQSSPNLRPSMSEAVLMLLGPCHLSKIELKNPEQSFWSSSPSHDGNIGKEKVAIVASNRAYAKPVYASAKSQGTKRPSRKTQSHPVTESMSKTAHGSEIEIEGDLHDTAMKAADLQMSSDDRAGLQMSQAHLSEISFGQSSMKADSNMNMTTSLEIGSSTQSEAVERHSLLSKTDVVLSLPKVDMKISIQCTVEKILEAFKNTHNRRICLYGRGGTGKTTLLKTLFHHSVTKELFDQVLLVTVPRFSYQKYVRNEIVQQLSLNIPESCSNDEIVDLIHQALADGKFLVLLDDVWESINLHEVGIPDPGPENNIWLVLATRSVDDCPVIVDREIEMEYISDTEAWELFSCQVGDIIDSPEIKPYARAIFNKCYRSPVILLAVGSALRAEKNIEEWKLAWKNLRLGDTANTNNRCFFIHHIKFCFDRLRSHDVKTCFLYTALFKEENEIDIPTLVEYFINEGLVGGTTVAAYKKGHDIVGQLTYASLIDANDNGAMVRMHHVVRDSALEILSSDIEGHRVFMESRKNGDQPYQENSWITMPVENSDAFNIQSFSIHKYLTRAGAHLKDSPSVEEWEQAKLIFLMDNEFSSLPSKPECSTLVALLLQRNNCLRSIPPSFFNSMSTLKILNLSGTRIKSLPDSFYKLSSLQILLLCNCERLLVLPPSIGILKSLEVLDLQGTEITHLPDSVGELASLKQLRVSFYGSMNRSEYKKLPSKFISHGIISSLRLRELGIFVYPGDQRWILNASSITKEISNLELSVLYFHFPRVENLEYFVHESQSWKDKDLASFNFGVGNDFKRIVSLVFNDEEIWLNEGQRCLRYVNGESIPNAVVNVLSRASSFYLDHHLSISYISQFGVYCFNGLKICILRDCPKLIAIVDNLQEGRILFPVLEKLSINNMWNFERILVGNFAMGSLARLQFLSVHACPKLKYVFTCSMLDNLSNLEELIIEDCESLEYIVIEDDSVKKTMSGNVGFISNEKGLPTLRSLKVLKLHYLPKLHGIWRGYWPLLEYLSFYSCFELKNLHMKGNDDVHIKEIATDKAWWDSLIWNDPELPKRLHKRLTQIHIDDL